jgi:hypothetical protein
LYLFADGLIGPMDRVLTTEDGNAEVASELNLSQVLLRENARRGDAVANCATLTIAVLHCVADESLEQVVSSLGLNLRMAWLPDLDDLILASPDVLVVGLSGPVPLHRVGLLIRQLRWRKPDLVVMLSESTMRMKFNFSIDLVFDASARQQHFRDMIVQATQMLRISRITRKATEPKPVGLPKSALDLLKCTAQ